MLWTHDHDANVCQGHQRSGCSNLKKKQLCAAMFTFANFLYFGCKVFCCCIHVAVGSLVFLQMSSSCEDAFFVSLVRLSCSSQSVPWLGLARPSSPISDPFTYTQLLMDFRVKKDFGKKIFVERFWYGFSCKKGLW